MKHLTYTTGLMAVTLMSVVTAASMLSMTGNWKGTISSEMRDSYAEIVITMYQSGNKISGRFVCHVGTLKCHAATADLTGTMEDNGFTGRISYADGHLCGLTGTLSDTTIKGEYSCNDAMGKDRGQWEATLDTPGSP